MQKACTQCSVAALQDRSGDKAGDSHAVCTGQPRPDSRATCQTAGDKPSMLCVLTISGRDFSKYGAHSGPMVDGFQRSTRCQAARARGLGCWVSRSNLQYKFQGAIRHRGFHSTSIRLHRLMTVRVLTAAGRDDIDRVPKVAHICSKLRGHFLQRLQARRGRRGTIPRRVSFL